MKQAVNIPEALRHLNICQDFCWIKQAVDIPEALRH
jgi:hypothetical protein